MRRLAIGPRTSAPSWEWVGQTLADRLAGRFDVTVFDSFAANLDADVVLVIKQRPDMGFMRRAAAQGARIVFAPIDVYSLDDEIAADAEMLGACDLVMTHSEALRAILARWCRCVLPVEHHARFLVPPGEATGQGDFLLWVGGLQHVAHVVGWHEASAPPLPLTILADIDSPRARLAAHAAAHALGLRLNIGADKVNGITAIAWHAETQAQLMKACRAAIDIKGDSFAQRTKPPTKAQQFVASGIPFGANAGHPAHAWFRTRGFALADAADWELLLSPRYRHDTQRLARALQEQLSVEAVEATWLAALEPLWPPVGNTA